MKFKFTIQPYQTEAVESVAGVPAPVPESCAEISEGVHALVQSIFDEHALDGYYGEPVMLF